MSLALIFLAFANHQDDYLQTLDQERKAIKEHLKQAVKNGQINLEHESATNIDDIFTVFNENLGQIKIFHYGGHANASHLALNGRDMKGNSLAGLMKTENKEGGVELAFLNGCATYGHVEQLLNAGVKRVIATSVPIGDDRACQFATQFYQSLAGGKSIDDAYADASSYLENYIDGENKFAHLGKIRFLEAFEEEMKETDELPWALYKKKNDNSSGSDDDDGGNWKIPPAPEKPDSGDTIQIAEKIYNIDHIDQANFS